MIRARTSKASRPHMPAASGSVGPPLVTEAQRREMIEKLVVGMSQRAIAEPFASGPPRRSAY